MEKPTWGTSEYFNGQMTAFDLFRKLPPEARKVVFVRDKIQEPREFQREKYEKVLSVVPQIPDLREGETQIEKGPCHGGIEFVLPSTFKMTYWSDCNETLEQQVERAAWSELREQELKRRSFFLAPVLYGERVGWDFHNEQTVGVVLVTEPEVDDDKAKVFSLLRVSWRFFVPEGNKKTVSAIEIGLNLFKLKYDMDVDHNPSTPEDLRSAKKLEDAYKAALAALK